MMVAGGSGAFSDRASSGRATSGRVADARVEDYLEKLRRALAGLSGEAASDILEELRGHIFEKAAFELAVAKEASCHAGRSWKSIGRARAAEERLAAQYLADDLLERAAHGWSPLLLLRGLLHWASLSAAGVLVLIGCVVGYFLGASFMLCAILKPLHPRTAGLWRLAGEPHSYSPAFGIWSYSSRRDRAVQLVDRAPRITHRWRIVLPDHTDCALVRPAISQIVCAQPWLIASVKMRGSEEMISRPDRSRAR